MEENVQRVFSIMIAVIVFFLLPLYVAFEKKDDVSYALALRVTNDFVENVQNNGYISKNMYDDLVTKLGTTGNIYKISMVHTAYKYNPVIFSYNDAAHTKLLQTFDYNMYKDQYINNGFIVDHGVRYDNLVVSYSRNQEVHTEQQIINTFAQSASVVQSGMTAAAYNAVNVNSIPLNPNIYNSGTLGQVYTMNKGDTFTVIVQNTNTTVAETLFNTLTVGMVAKPIPRVYVNFGCTIQNEMYKNW